MGSDTASQDAKKTSLLNETYRVDNISSIKTDMKILNLIEKERKSDLKKSKLKVLTYNVGFLDFKLLGQTVARVPDINQRRAEFLRVFNSWLKANDPDVIFLQEMWYLTDVKMIEKDPYISQNYYIYTIVIPPPQNSSDGLMTLVKRSSVQPTKTSHAIGRRTIPLTPTSTAEAIVGFERNCLAVNFMLPNSSSIYTANCHATAGLSNTDIRSATTKKLAEHLVSVSRNYDYILVGADFNASPTFSNALPDEEEQWNKNREPYVTFINGTRKLGLIDSYWAVNSDDGFTQDRKNNNLTARSSSTKDEPEQRIDFIFLGKNQETTTLRDFYVDSSRLVFTDKLLDAKGNLVAGENGVTPTFLSDHFGVFTEFTLTSIY
jgi:exonuclease III